MLVVYAPLRPSGTARGCCEPHRRFTAGATPAIRVASLAAHAWARLPLPLRADRHPGALLVQRARARSPSWEGFSFRWYAALWNDDEMQECIANSLIVGGAGDAASRRSSARSRRWRLSRAPGSAASPPPPRCSTCRSSSRRSSIGAATLTFFSRHRVATELLTVVIAHVAFSVSYVAIVVRARLAGFDRSLEEAAMDLGPGRWARSGG